MSAGPLWRAPNARFWLAHEAHRVLIAQMSTFAIRAAMHKYTAWRPDPRDGNRVCPNAM